MLSLVSTSLSLRAEKKMTQALEMVSSERGKVKIIVDGYVLRCEKSLNNRNYWACEKPKKRCKGRAVTIIRNGQHYLVSSKEHTHAPESFRSHELSLQASSQAPSPDYRDEPHQFVQSGRKTSHSRGSYVEPRKAKRKVVYKIRPDETTTDFGNFEIPEHLQGTTTKTAYFGNSKVHGHFQETTTGTDDFEVLEVRGHSQQTTAEPDYYVALQGHGYLQETVAFAELEQDIVIKEEVESNHSGNDDENLISSLGKATRPKLVLDYVNDDESSRLPRIATVIQEAVDGPSFNSDFQVSDGVSDLRENSDRFPVAGIKIEKDPYLQIATVSSLSSQSCKSSSEDKLNEISQLVSSMASKQQDMYSHFGNYVASVLRQVGGHRAILMQNEISNVIFRHMSELSS